jgi:hypothetical protein
VFLPKALLSHLSRVCGEPPQTYWHERQVTVASSFQLVVEDKCISESYLSCLANPESDPSHLPHLNPDPMIAYLAQRRAILLASLHPL